MLEERGVKDDYALDFIDVDGLDGIVIHTYMVDKKFHVVGDVNS